MERPLLILDIDETLLFATEKPLDRPHDFLVGSYRVYKRPNLDKFLSTVNEWFDLAVWTSSGEEYATMVIRQLFLGSNELRFQWSRQRCTRRFDPETREEYWIKDLKKVKKIGFDLDKILMIDDSPEKLQRQYGNHIHVNQFVGDQKDSELEKLLPFLESIRFVSNVRVVEKTQLAVL